MMNQNLDPVKVVAEFSYFWVPKGGGYGYLAQRSPQLVSQMEKLVKALVDRLAAEKTWQDHEADLQQMVDRWARYFLLIARHTDEKFTEKLGIPKDDLAACVQKVAELAEINIGLDAIYRALHQPDAKPQQVADKHHRDFVMACLQRPAWFASKKVHQRISRQGLGSEGVEECFAIANSLISDLHDPGLLGKFDFDRNNQIRSFVGTFLPDCIRDKVVGSARIRAYGNAGKLKPGNPQKVLHQAGFKGDRLKGYCLLWLCYRSVHQPRQEGRQSLPEPTPEQWQQIANCFNQRRAELLPQPDGIDSATAQQMMAECVKAVDDYYAQRSKPNLSLDAPVSPGDSSTRTPGETLEDEQGIDPIAYVAHNEVTALVNKAFAKLSAIEQAALALWKGLDLTQTEVVELLGRPPGFKNQTSVTHITKTKLPKALLAEQYSDEAKNNPKVLKQRHEECAKEITEALKAYLPDYCQTWLYGMLTTIEQRWAESPPVDRQAALKAQLIEKLHISDVNACPEADSRLTALIEAWLQST